MGKPSGVNVSAARVGVCVIIGLVVDVTGASAGTSGLQAVKVIRLAAKTRKRIT